jgi:hypothetical protein
LLAALAIIGAPQLAVPESAAGKAKRLLENGKWGGDHVQLEVDAAKARIEFDCGHGAIEQPFSLEQDGSFDLAGTFTREGGPTREQEDRQPVRYKGRADEKALSLSVEWADGRVEGPFKLQQGRDVHLRKCD